MQARDLLSTPRYKNPEGQFNSKKLRILNFQFTKNLNLNMKILILIIFIIFRNEITMMIFRISTKPLIKYDNQGMKKEEI